MSRARLRGIAAISFTSLLWGTTGTAATFAPGVGPLAIGAAALGIGGLLQAVVAIPALRQSGAALHAKLGIVILGAMAVAVYPLAFYSSMHYAGVAIGSVVSLASAPLASGLLERVVDRSPLSRWWMLAAGLGIAGSTALCASKLDGPSADAAPTLVGIGLGLVAGVTYSMYSWVVHGLMRSGIDRSAAMGSVFGAGGALLLPVLLLTGAPLVASAQNLAVAGYMALVPMFLGYLAFGYGLTKVSASTATTVTLTEPAIATVLAVVIVGERLGPFGWAGLCVIGLVLIILAFAPTNTATPPDLSSQHETAYPPVETVDYHTGGEPFRIVPRPPVGIPGSTVAERRALAITDPAIDGLRQVLCFEPRGHADMYGGFITPPNDDGAHFGVLFWHKDGFSTACGHGTMALGAWAIDTGLVEADPSGSTDVIIDVPSGRVTARVRTDGDGRPRAVEFVNVPSRLVAQDVAVATTLGECRVVLGWGGALYACIDVASVDLRVSQEELNWLITLGREVKAALANDPRIEHPADPRLSGVYGTIFFEDLGTLPTGELHQRNVTVFADGQVDRSPCGSGTAARVAVLHATGALGDGQDLVHDSIVGTRFRARVQEMTSVYGEPAVVPVVTGNAYKVAQSTFVVDPRDELTPGFVLR